MIEKIRLFVVSTILISLAVQSKPQIESYDIYQVDLHSIQPHMNRYQSNPFLNYRPENNDNVENTFIQNKLQGSMSPPANSACLSYWSYQSDLNENFGLITIPEPHYQKSVIRVMLSIAAQLPSVSSLISTDASFFNLLAS